MFVQWNSITNCYKYACRSLKFVVNSVEIGAGFLLGIQDEETQGPHKSLTCSIQLQYTTKNKIALSFNYLSYCLIKTIVNGKILYRNIDF